MIFKDAFESYLHSTDVSSRKFATLGPNGPSSRLAAEKFASHYPAPSHIIHGSIDHPEIRVVNADSPHPAAEQTFLGKCDACLTTQVAAEIFGLEILSVALPTIPMLWTVFINNDYMKLEYGTESCHHPVR